MQISWTWRARRLPDEVRDEILRRLESVRPFFPELRPRLRIGLTRFFEGFVFQSHSGSTTLSLEVKRRRTGEWKYPTHWTIAHELMHLVQFNSEQIPGGERACDILALARLPPRFIDESPTYLYVPTNAREVWTQDDAELAHSLAESALEMLKEGDDGFESFWENEFERAYEASRGAKQ
ncbi:TPA: hypothetical protein HA259_07670 [Thermoplasmata archaeon]|nr:hypothetical protein [Thermoplasmata archaeon]